MSMLFVEINRFEPLDLCVWHGSTLPRIRIDFEYAKYVYQTFNASLIGTSE